MKFCNDIILDREKSLSTARRYRLEKLRQGKFYYNLQPLIIPRIIKENDAGVQIYDNPHSE